MDILTPRISRLVVTLCAVFVFSSSALQAQETTLAGVIADSTGAMLPGVTVTAVHGQSGNVFVGVADELGQYRLSALRPGMYTVTAELSGFATVVHEGLELLVGQRGVLNFKMTVSSLQETVTVTGESPLVDVTQSKLGGNIDTRQMQELPINGRNWLDLTMLAPGSRVNSVGAAPFGGIAGQFQLNVDGQQVTQNMTSATYGIPKFGRDAIAELEFVTSRFDATQGRSVGVQVNAVTKSGTNAYAGTLSGFFRDDRFNAKDFVVDRVLPYSDQQVSGTFGGPIRKDRVHFFGYYEGEHEPRSTAFTSAFPRFNIPDLTDPMTENKGGGRLDAQFTNRTRLMIRGNAHRNFTPNVIASGFTGGATSHPSRGNRFIQEGQQFIASLTQTIGTRTVNELKIGYTYILDDEDSIVATAPEIQLVGYTVGHFYAYPLKLSQKTYSLRDDFTYLRGRHELKIGGEFLYQPADYFYKINSPPTIDALGGPIPANIEDLFPVWNDPTTWNLAALSPITRVVREGIGDFDFTYVLPQYAAWLQDNLQVSSRLTLNLGVRWDLPYNGMSNNIVAPPIRGKAPQDWLNIAPRLGFAYTMGERTVMRGGFGKYFSSLPTVFSSHTTYFTQVANVAIPNDGRPNFAADPWNLAGGGRRPSYEEAKSNPKYQLDVPAGNVTADNVHTPYAYQTSIGVQRQLRQTMSIQADYVWIAGRREATGRNINLSYDPVTGVNYPFTDVSKRPFPTFGSNLAARFTDGESNYHGLETAFTKRLSNRFQAAATYTLSGTLSSSPLPLNPGCRYPINGLTMTCDTPLTVAPDLGGEYSLAAGDQRHRAVFNGILNLPADFQISGLHFYGSGQRRSTTYGGDLRRLGPSAPGGGGRLRPDQTIVPRNNFVGRRIHRTDLRIQRTFRLGGRVRVDGMLEVFNLFNHANYGNYTTQESSPRYGQPGQNPEVAYQPRMLQLGFRASF